MYTVEISDDTADLIFRNILIDDHQRLSMEIKNLEQNINSLQPYELEDLNNNKRWCDAMKIVMEYYLSHNHMMEIIKANNN